MATLENESEIAWGKIALAAILAEHKLRCVMEDAETDFREHLLNAKRMRLLTMRYNPRVTAMMALACVLKKNRVERTSEIGRPPIKHSYL